jgi:hydrogenase maturation protein HypF
MGAWFNNTLCITVGNEAHISRSVGHLGTAEACRDHEYIARQLLVELGMKPHAIAHDLHPDFHSSRFAAQLATELDVPLIAVQHHHAHIAAVCAERHLDQTVLGLALDGVGLGSDGTAWGGELLHVQGARFERIGHLRPLPLPGADHAAQQPWRMAAAVLHELGRGGEITRRFPEQTAASTVAIMLQRDLNCPRTSSMGRVFDAAAGLLGLCAVMEYDAQAAIALEQAATRHIETHGYPQVITDGWRITSDGKLDLLPMLQCLIDERDAGLGAARFHTTLVAALADWLRQAALRTGITTLVCGGGCFFNKLLLVGLREQLAGTGLTMHTPTALLPGDTAISLGQAWVATQQI